MENRLDTDCLDRHQHTNNISNNNNKSIDNLCDYTIGISEKMMEYSSWHSHVYGNPPKNPTPHLIADILGWNCEDKLNVEDEPLNLTTRDRSPDDRITSSAEPVLLNGDSNSSRECRTPRRDSPIKLNSAEIGRQLSRKNAAIKSKSSFSPFIFPPNISCT